jgi:Ala-tRNA(Pro) deacylase
VAEAKQLRGTLPGGNCKSLFLKNKKGKMWLVVLPEDHRTNLIALADRLGTKRLSFASPERLQEYLGVIPGAVTPFAAANDVGGLVDLVVAAELLNEPVLNFHPLVNDRTTTISSADFLLFLNAIDHPPLLVATSEI